mgnify:CR=1 FL=1
MANIPVRVIIRVTRQDNRPRKRRALRWIGYERGLASLWETGYFI